MEWVRESRTEEGSVSQSVSQSITDIFVPLWKIDLSFVKRNEALKTHAHKVRQTFSGIKLAVYLAVFMHPFKWHSCGYYTE